MNAVFVIIAGIVLYPFFAASKRRGMSREASLRKARAAKRKKRKK